MTGRRVLTVVLLCVVLLAVGPPPSAAHTVRLTPPVDGAVLAGFDAPDRYGPGHRGVDLAAAVGTSVRASAAGTVTFAGVVVADRWVTVDHGPVRTTVGPLATTAVRRGDRVRRGDVLGTSGHAHDVPAVHWSARVEDRYVDPLSWGVPMVASLVPVPTTGPDAATGARAHPHRPTPPGRPTTVPGRMRVRVR